MANDTRDGKDHPTDPLIGDSPASDGEGDQTEQERFHRLFGEKLLPEILRRGIESGMDTFARSDRGVRKVLSDLKLRRELTNYFFHQIDETKNAALRVIAREVREFLESTNLEQSLYSVLTSLAFEVRTEVRFVPTDDGPLKPVVKSKVQGKRPENERSKNGKSRKRARGTRPGTKKPA